MTNENTASASTDYTLSREEPRHEQEWVDRRKAKPRPDVDPGFKQAVSKWIKDPDKEKAHRLKNRQLYLQGEWEA